MSYIFLNPAYRLRQDGNRVILYGEDTPDGLSEEWFSFIHPYHAMMLSFFKGEYEKDVELGDFASHFGFSLSEAEKIVSEYILKPAKNVNYKNLTFYFPKNVLLVNDKRPEKKPQAYSCSDFKADGIPDLFSLRTKMPVAINLELTMKCFVDCCYCYADRSIQRHGQMTTGQVVALIEQAKKSGVISFDINGGEVLFHPGIFEILTALFANGYKPLVSTKIPVTREHIGQLKECGVRKFQISLDCANEALLKKIVNAPIGYLDRMRDTLSDVCKAGLSLDINVVLTRFNCSQEIITELFDFLEKYNCIESVRLNVCGYSIYKSNFRDIRPSQHDVFSIENLISSPGFAEKYHFKIRMSGYDKACDYQQPTKGSAFEGRALCTGNMRNIVVLPNGDVTICEELYANPNFIIGNVLKNSIEEIWNSEKALELFYHPISRDSKSSCSECEVQSKCRSRVGVCWKTVLMAYGKENWDFPDPRCPKAPLPYNEIYIK